MTEAIRYFQEQFGPVVDAVFPGADALRDYPAFLQAFWRDVGFGSREDGFVWLVNPLDLTWFTPLFDLDRDLIPFARTSFGDFHLFDRNGRCYFYSPNYRELLLVAEAFDAAVMTLGEPEYTDDDDLFARHQALWREGQRVEATTCFCLSPAVPLGGNELTSDVYVGDLHAYCQLLRDS